MNNDDKGNIFQVTYCFSYKEWSRQIGLQYWPGYACVIATGLFGVLVRPSDTVILCLLLASIVVLFFCYFVTRFYANSILKITGNGLTISKKEQTKHFNWTDISEIVFILPSHGASHLEVVIAIYSKNNEIDYINIESLYFKWANVKAKEIGYWVEKYFEGYTFKIHKSTFYAPIMMRGDRVPIIEP